MRIIIQENQRGLLFKNGKFVKLLEAGRYFIFGTQNMEIVKMDQQLTSETC